MQFDVVGVYDDYDLLLTLIIVGVVCDRFVECTHCGRKQHQICALHMEQIWPNEFVCAVCCSQNSIKRRENKYSAKR